jgi:hypothetical protein
MDSPLVNVKDRFELTLIQTALYVNPEIQKRPERILRPVLPIEGIDQVG